jgi:hypothetical protein
MPEAQVYALFVGIAEYRHLSDLAKTTTDARDLHDLLADGGYPEANRYLLLDKQATKAAISDGLDWLARRAGPGDTALFFFSGHGAQRIGGFEPGEYLCPVETDWYNLHGTAISDREFSTALQAIRAGRIAVFLDACHSGGVGEPKDAAFQIKSGLSEVAYARLTQGRGRAVIASCRPDEVSWELEGMRNGLFSHYMLEGLRGAAAGAGGVVRILNLFDYVSQKVPQHKEQHPLFKGQLETSFPIIVVKTAPSDRNLPAAMPGQPVALRAMDVDPNRVDATTLRNRIHSTYSIDELKVLCTDLGKNYDDLRGDTPELKILHLINWHKHRRRYGQLVRKVLADRPFLAQELL